VTARPGFRGIRRARSRESGPGQAGREHLPPRDPGAIGPTAAAATARPRPGHARPRGAL